MLTVPPVSRPASKGNPTREHAKWLALCREALAGWREIGLPVMEALTAIDMATLLDPTIPEVQAAAASARDILTGLGARPFLDRLGAVLGQRGSVEDGRTAVPTGAATGGV